MDMTGEQRIPARREIVWQALNDADILRACIPGCKELFKTSDTEMTAVAVIKVGPISARFEGAVTLSDIDPPNGYRITGEGQGGMAGNAKGGALVRLEGDGDSTILHYDVQVQIGGKLAQLGGRMIDATAKSLSAAFFKSFSAQIVARQSGAGDASAPFVSVMPPSSPESLPPPIQRPASGETTASRADWATIALLGVMLGVVAWMTMTDAATLADDYWNAVHLVMVLAIGFLLGRR